MSSIVFHLLCSFGILGRELLCNSGPIYSFTFCRHFKYFVCTATCKISLFSIAFMMFWTSSQLFLSHFMTNDIVNATNITKRVCGFISDYIKMTEYSIRFLADDHT